MGLFPAHRVIRRDAEFGRYWGIADIDQPAPMKFDLLVRALSKKNMPAQVRPKLAPGGRF
jgi:hypothetical protein